MCLRPFHDTNLDCMTIYIVHTSKYRIGSTKQKAMMPEGERIVKEHKTTTVNDPRCHPFIACLAVTGQTHVLPIGAAWLA